MTSNRCPNCDNFQPLTHFPDVKSDPLIFRDDPDAAQHLRQCLARSALPFTEVPPLLQTIAKQLVWKQRTVISPWLMIGCLCFLSHLCAPAAPFTMIC